jgi:hypothetical protein
MVVTVILSERCRVVLVVKHMEKAKTSEKNQRKRGPVG